MDAMADDGWLGRSRDESSESKKPARRSGCMVAWHGHGQRTMASRDLTTTFQERRAAANMRRRKAGNGGMKPFGTCHSFGNRLACLTSRPNQCRNVQMAINIGRAPPEIRTASERPGEVMRIDNSYPWDLVGAERFWFFSSLLVCNPNFSMQHIIHYMYADVPGLLSYYIYRPPHFIPTFTLVDLHNDLQAYPREAEMTCI